jgi:hypothetical protein
MSATVPLSRTDNAVTEQNSLSSYLLTHILWLAGAITSVDFLVRAATLVPQEADTTIPEGSVLYSVRRLVTDGALYRDYNEPPYATTPYTPLLYFATGGVGTLLGLTDNVEALYQVGRLVVLAASLGCMGLLLLLARGTVHPKLALLAPLSTTWCSFLLPWATTTRPDYLAILFSLGVVWVLGGAGGEGKTKRLALAAGMAGAAIAAKQSAIAAPLTAVLLLVGRRRFREALTFATLAACIVAAEFGLLQWRWPHFWQNVVGANVAPVLLERVFVLSAWFCTRAWPLLVVGTLGWFLSLRCKSPTVRFFHIHALLSLGLAVAACAKAGADLNYFIEPVFSLAFFVPHAIQRLQAAGRLVRAVSVVLAAGVLLGIIYRTLDRWTTPIEVPPTRAVLEKAESFGRPVLFQDSGLALRYGEPILLLDSFNASYLCEAGVLDVSALAQRLRRREIAAVVVRQMSLGASVWEVSWIPRPLVSEAAAHYELADYVYPNAWFYRPKQRAKGN